jgi:peptide/nickel transport system permease protein
MLIFIVRRLVWAVMLAFVISLLTFVMFFVLPSSRNAQRNERGFETSMQAQFDVHGSFPEQYVRFVGHVVLHGDLGESTRGGGPVLAEIERTLPVTLSLLAGGAVLWLLLAFPIGLISALRPRSLLDRLLMLLVLAGVSAHPVWLGLVLSYLFGFKWHVFPIGGYCDLHYRPDSSNLCGGPRFWAYHMFLPWLTFALLFAALYARMIRASLLEALEEDYVRTARAKGAGTFRILRSHVLRNSLLPVVTMLGMDIGIAFGGALFIESVFQLPGMGRLLVRSLTTEDLPMVMGVVLVVGAAVVLANLFVDILYSLLDPRVRLHGKSDTITASRGLRRELRAKRRVRESATQTQ